VRKHLCNKGVVNEVYVKGGGVGSQSRAWCTERPTSRHTHDKIQNIKI